METGPCASFTQTSGRHKEQIYSLYKEWISPLMSKYGFHNMDIFKCLLCCMPSTFPLNLEVLFWKPNLTMGSCKKYQPKRNLAVLKMGINFPVVILWWLLWFLNKCVKKFSCCTYSRLTTPLWKHADEFSQNDSRCNGMVLGPLTASSSALTNRGEKAVSLCLHCTV